MLILNDIVVPNTTLHIANRERTISSSRHALLDNSRVRQQTSSTCPAALSTADTVFYDDSGQVCTRGLLPTLLSTEGTRVHTRPPTWLPHWVATCWRRYLRHYTLQPCVTLQLGPLVVQSNCIAQPVRGCRPTVGTRQTEGSCHTIIQPYGTKCYSTGNLAAAG